MAPRVCKWPRCDKPARVHYCADHECERPDCDGEKAFDGRYCSLCQLLLDTNYYRPDFTIRKEDQIE